MFKRLLQAATLTFLLNLLAHISQPTVEQSSVVSPQPITPKLVMKIR